jgi:hypothetical protein
MESNSLTVTPGEFAAEETQEFYLYRYTHARMNRLNPSRLVPIVSYEVGVRECVA